MFIVKGPPQVGSPSCVPKRGWFKMLQTVSIHKPRWYWAFAWSRSSRLASTNSFRSFPCRWVARVLSGAGSGPWCWSHPSHGSPIGIGTRVLTNKCNVSWSFHGSPIGIGTRVLPSEGYRLVVAIQGLEQATVLLSSVARSAPWGKRSSRAQKPMWPRGGTLGQGSWRGLR